MANFKSFLLLFFNCSEFPNGLFFLLNFVASFFFDFSLEFCDEIFLLRLPRHTF